MPGKSLVVDVSIRIRAVLGNKARALLESYGGNASFFVPEPAYLEAEEHLAALMVKRGRDPGKALTLLRALRGLVDLVGADIDGALESKNGWALEIRKIGLSWPRLWRSAGRAGRKTRTSSAAEWRHGLPAALRCS